MEALRLNHVAFCGENPGMALLDVNTKEITASLSYWFCTYSPYGEGHALFIQLDAANSATLNHPAVAIYSDNLPLARYLANTFTQYFEGWEDKNLPQISAHPARFFKESDTRSFYRVACYAENTAIEMLWSDIRDISLRTIPNVDIATDFYHIATVFFLCAKARITINNQQVSGEVNLQTRDDGRMSSSAFVALAETWVKVIPEVEKSE